MAPTQLLMLMLNPFLEQANLDQAMKSSIKGETAPHASPKTAPIATQFHPSSISLTST